MLHTLDIGQDGVVGVVSCWEGHGDGTRDNGRLQQLPKLSCIQHGTENHIHDCINFAN